MRELLIRIICAMLMFRIGVGVHKLTHRPPLPQAVTVLQPEPRHYTQPVAYTTTKGWTSFSDLLTDDDTLTYNGYLIATRYKKVEDEWLREEQGYVALVRHGKTIRSFDGMAYHALGNITGFGLFSFLGNGVEQIAISQDTSRGGAQWIVDVSHGPKVIFDGAAWNVGRESADCEVKDVDGDGTFEILLPITNFYALMDKMAVAGCPLPMITFKYDEAKREYLPVNHLLHQSSDLTEPRVSQEPDELYFRSAVLDHLLELVYRGTRDEAWQYFDRTYNLEDKREIELRVKEILRDQPVYKYIYKR